MAHSRYKFIRRVLAPNGEPTGRAVFLDRGPKRKLPAQRKRWPCITVEKIATEYPVSRKPCLSKAARRHFGIPPVETT